MNNYELHSRAHELAASHSGYNLARRLLALEEELQEARRDSDRYQWLRYRPIDTIDKGGVFAGHTPENVILNGEDLDEYIDKAMGGEHE